MNLEILKIYIKNNLINGFIKFFKFSAGAFILFDEKSDESLRLYMNYCGLNNLIIKNQYLLLLVKELLGRLNWTQRFTLFDLTNTYYEIRIIESDELKMVFKTHYNHFGYQILSFGLINVLTTFYSYFNKILVEKIDIFIIVYLDDILIYTESQGKKYVKAVQ